MTNHLLMLARMNRGRCWSGGYFFKAWGNGQARRSQQRYSGACGSPVRPPRRPAGLIGEVEAAAEGSRAGVAGGAEGGGGKGGGGAGGMTGVSAGGSDVSTARTRAGL